MATFDPGSFPNGRTASTLPGEQIGLVLQGGGALGAYQAGAYAGLAEAGLHPYWISGVSIGAINSTLIAGNPPESRTARLRAFWEKVSRDPVPLARHYPSALRPFANMASAVSVLLQGVPGFFRPRIVPPALQLIAGPESTSFYDLEPLRATLSELADFCLINSAPPRLTVGAVDVASGNSFYFDNYRQPLTPDHILASGALPPGFPPIEVDGHFYWDGGILSNTPLDYLLDTNASKQDLCIFQFDLFSARGPLPKTIFDVEQREKDIRFSSRTRLSTDKAKEIHAARRAVRQLVARLPASFADDPDVAYLARWGEDAAITIIHFIYRVNAYESLAKDFEFSRATMNDHWNAGLADVRAFLAHDAWRHRQPPEHGVLTIDANDITAAEPMPRPAAAPSSSPQPKENSHAHEG